MPIWGCGTWGGMAPEGVRPLKIKICITQLFLKPGTYFFVWKNIITPTFHMSMAILWLWHWECVAPEGVWTLKIKISITQSFLKPGTCFFVEEHNHSALHRSMAIMGVWHWEGVAPEGVWPLKIKISITQSLLDLELNYRTILFKYISSKICWQHNRQGFKIFILFRV